MPCFLKEKKIPTLISVLFLFWCKWRSNLDLIRRQETLAVALLHNWQEKKDVCIILQKEKKEEGHVHHVARGKGRKGVGFYTQRKGNSVHSHGKS